MTGDYRAHTDQLNDIQKSFTTVSKNVETLESELTEINDRIKKVQGKIDDTGKLAFNCNAGKAGSKVRLKET